MPNNETEPPITRIACAAVRVPSGGFHCGPNHAWILLKHATTTVKVGEQGFVNHRGEFLTRKQALYFAEVHGQIRHKHAPADRLMSEDLWADKGGE